MDSFSTDTEMIKNRFDVLYRNGLFNDGNPIKEINKELKNKISDDLLEVFCNTHHHANTTNPFFVGGQYYPTLGILKFTMVDLGDGFLPSIAKATNGEINDSLKSIEWALEGNSSKLAIDH